MNYLDLDVIWFTAERTPRIIIKLGHLGVLNSSSNWCVINFYSLNEYEARYFIFSTD